MAEAKLVRFVNRTTGSVVVVPAARAEELAGQYRTLGLQPESEHEPGKRLRRREFRATEKAPTKKAATKPAKKAASSKSEN